MNVRPNLFNMLVAMSLTCGLFVTIFSLSPQAAAQDMLPASACVAAKSDCGEANGVFRLLDEDPNPTPTPTPTEDPNGGGAGGHTGG